MTSTHPPTHPLNPTHTQWKLKSNSVVMHIVRDDDPDLAPYYTTWFYKYDPSLPVRTHTPLRVVCVP